MNDIILIVCYIGKLPSYFRMFLDSCVWNPNIDFLLITDNSVDKENVSSNVRIVNKNIEDIRALIKTRISVNAKLTKAYKLCDYKPAYGALFYEYIKNYKYWGHCDIDLIWGNIGDIIQPLLVKGCDRFFKYGHLTLYKNTYEIANLYKKNYSGITYDVVFSSDISCGFDEQGGSWKLAEEAGYSLYHDNICFDIKYRKLQKNLAVYKLNNYKNQCFIIENGHIYRYYKDKDKIIKEEKAYIHFQKRAMFSEKLYKDKAYQFLYDRVIELSNNYSIEDCFKRNVDKKLSLIQLVNIELKNFCQAIRYKLFLYKTKFILTNKK